MKGLLIVLFGLLVQKIQGYLQILGNQQLIEKVWLTEPKSRGKPVFLPHRTKDVGVLPYGFSLYISYRTNEDNPSGCKDRVMTFDEYTKPIGSKLAMFFDTVDCDLTEKTKMALRIGATHIFIFRSYFRRNSPDIPLTDFSYKAQLPVAFIDFEEIPRAVFYMGSNNNNKRYGETYLKWHLKIKRAPVSNVTLLLDSLQKKDFEIFATIIDKLQEKSPQMAQFREKIRLQVNFKVTGCSVCSEETIKKYCVPSNGKPVCVVHTQPNIQKAAEAAVLLKTVLETAPSKDKFISPQAKQVLLLYSQKCLNGLEAASSNPKSNQTEAENSQGSTIDLQKCLNDILESEEAGFRKFKDAFKKNLDQLKLFSYAGLQEDSKITDHFSKKVNISFPMFLVNGCLIRGGRIENNLFSAVCGSLLPGSKADLPDPSLTKQNYEIGEDPKQNMGSLMEKLEEKEGKRHHQKKKKAKNLKRKSQYKKADFEPLPEFCRQFKPKTDKATREIIRKKAADRKMKGQEHNKDLLLKIAIFLTAAIIIVLVVYKTYRISKETCFFDDNGQMGYPDSSSPVHTHTEVARKESAELVALPEKSPTSPEESFQDLVMSPPKLKTPKDSLETKDYPAKKYFPEEN